MIIGKIRSKLISIALYTYDAGIFITLNVLSWRNHLWNTKKWTTVPLTKNLPEFPKKMGAKNAPISETA